MKKLLGLCVCALTFASAQMLPAEAEQCDCQWTLTWDAPTSNIAGAVLESPITYDVYEDGRLLLSDVVPRPNDWTWAWPVVYGNGKCWQVRSVIHLPMMPPATEWQGIYTDVRLESEPSATVCKNNEETSSTSTQKQGGKKKKKKP